jgi:hypothetical protein
MEKGGTMYKVSIAGPECDAAAIASSEIDSLIEDLGAVLSSILVPGRRVTWIIECPNGRVVRGDITTNSFSTDVTMAVADHVDFVQGVLIGVARLESEMLPADEAR